VKQKELSPKKITKARADAASLIAQTNKELEAEKKLTLQQLETQIDELRQLIIEKLLGEFYSVDNIEQGDGLSGE
jgi:F0F1-type ATP synthase membrane subunit b/b'